VKKGAVVAANVSRRFRLHGQRTRTLKEVVVRRKHVQTRDVWAVRDVSFTVEPGESVGLVGRNGSGKTTLLRMIAGIFQPTEGQIEVSGSIGSLLGLGAGFHPDFTGRENVFLNGSLHGLSRRYVRERMDEIVSFAELEEFIDAPVRTYSSGMFMRLGFSVATHLQSDVLLLDEVFAVGDEAFQRKCFGKIFEFKSRGGTIFFVSHSAAAVESLCERALLLRNGRLELDGPTRDAIARYQALLAEDEDPEERGAGLAGVGERGGARDRRAARGRCRRAAHAVPRRGAVPRAAARARRCRVSAAAGEHRDPCAGRRPDRGREPAACRPRLGGRRGVGSLGGRRVAAGGRAVRRGRLARGRRRQPRVPPPARGSELRRVLGRGVAGGLVRLEGRWSLAGDASTVSAA
jgi:ABC-type polysaccharide/polyol phosphate transport system ATPase subunit